jgi:simple sugar transport system permease protein
MATAAGGTADERVRKVGIVRKLLNRPELGAVAGAILVFAFFAVVAGDRGFLTSTGTASYLEVSAQLGIVAIPVALLMISGEFDLSVGSMVGAAGILIAIPVAQFGWPLWAALLLAFAVALVVGFLNGYLVVKTGLPSFIVTLATLFIIRGASSVLTSTVSPITYIPVDPTKIASDPLGALFAWNLPIQLGGGATTSIQVSIFFWVLIAVVGVYVLGRTRFGNWIAGVGGSGAAARNLGVPVARVKIALFALTGFSAAVLAAIQTTRFTSADILRGTGYELDAITTAVIGGSLLTGGYGSVAGTALGALALGMARQGIVFADINADWYKIAIGTLLLVAVVLNSWIRRKFAGLT